MGCLKLHTEKNYITLKVVYSAVNTSVLAEQEEKNTGAFLQVAYRNAQGNGGTDWGAVGNAAFYTEQGLGTVGWAASSSANSGFKYGYRGMAQAEAAAAKSLGTIAKTTKILGHAAAGLSVVASGAQFYYSDRTGADYARLGGAAIITGTAFIPIAGPFISIGLGVLDSYGAFDGIYNSFGPQPTLYPGRR